MKFAMPQAVNPSLGFSLKVAPKDLRRLQAYGFLCYCAPLVVAAILITNSVSGSSLAAAALAVISLGFAVWVLVRITHVSLEADTEGIVGKNVLSTVHAKWEDIATISLRYRPVAIIARLPVLRITLTSGKRIAILAVPINLEARQKELAQLAEMAPPSVTFEQEGDHAPKACRDRSR